MKKPTIKTLSCIVVSALLFAGCAATTTTESVPTPPSTESSSAPEQPSIEPSTTSTQPSTSDQEPRALIRIHVNEFGQMMYKGKEVTPVEVGNIFKQEGADKGRPATLTVTSDTSPELFMHCRNDLIAQGLPNIRPVNQREFIATTEAE